MNLAKGKRVGEKKKRLYNKKKIFGGRGFVPLWRARRGEKIIYGEKEKLKLCSLGRKRSQKEKAEKKKNKKRKRKKKKKKKGGRLDMGVLKRKRRKKGKCLHETSGNVHYTWGKETDQSSSRRKPKTIKREETEKKGFPGGGESPPYSKKSQRSFSHRRRVGKKQGVRTSTWGGEGLPF